jgi:hypothetical protein
MFHIVGMVVPEDEEQWFIQAGNDKIKVIEREVSGGKNQINIRKTLFYVGRVDLRVDLVGNAEYFQGQALRRQKIRYFLIFFPLCTKADLPI